MIGPRIMAATMTSTTTARMIFHFLLPFPFKFIMIKFLRTRPDGRFFFYFFTFGFPVGHSSLKKQFAQSGFLAVQIVLPSVMMCMLKRIQ